MTNQTYIVEVNTNNGLKIVFVKAETRGKAIKSGNAQVSKDEITGPSKARAIPDQRATDMVNAAEFDIIDIR